MKRNYLYIGAIVIVIIIALFDRCAQRKAHNEELQQNTRNATSLLQDTLEKSGKEKDAYWSVIVSEISPKEIDKDMLDELNYNQQLLLIELAKYKNLVASYQTEYIGKKTDTITMFVRIPVLRPFVLSFLDTIGGYRYIDSVFVDSNMVRRVHLPTLQFTHDVRITKNRKGNVSGEIRIKGLDEFNLISQNVYSFYSQSLPADIRRRKWMKGLKIAGTIGLGTLSFYAGTQVN